MKKQFSIKSAQLLKNITKSAAKIESTNILKFASAEEQICCKNIILQSTGVVALPQ